MSHELLVLKLLGSSQATGIVVLDPFVLVESTTD